MQDSIFGVQCFVQNGGGQIKAFRNDDGAAHETIEVANRVLSALGRSQYGNRLAALGNCQLLDLMRAETVQNLQTLGFELGSSDRIHRLTYMVTSDD